MKEYLRRNAGGTYSYVGTVHPDHVHDLLIEIPEGAVKAYLNKSNTINFVNADDDFVNSATKGEWVDTHRGKHEDSGHVLVWSRPTIPEELTFVDDFPDFSFEDTVNHPSHNHYFIDVSDVDEVDFYEIALRYNVTDPCIQHILKKCLAVGNRGHKDFHTDLKDIYDTADRALRIHGG